MQREYYAVKQAELRDSLIALEQAAKELEEAKEAEDKNARDQAKKKMNQAAKSAVNIEPHLAYLWFKACGSELDNSIQDAWQNRQKRQKSLNAGALPQTFHFTPERSAITHLPYLSFILHIPFTLKKPYLSKDETDFHLLDNPLRREKAFRVPMVASTSWKGALRAALWQLGYKEGHEVTIRLLGNPRESDEQQAGRLYFFPTFFNQIGLEVINPHDRKTGVGTQRGPILMECVPIGREGTFTLLYVPFDRIGQDEAETRRQVAEDLEVLAKGVQVMLTTYGFGAKTSSGFGVAQDTVESGQLTLKISDLTLPKDTEAQIEEPEESFLKYLDETGKVKPDFTGSGEGGLLSNSEYKQTGEQHGGGSLSEFKRFRTWYIEHGDQWQRNLQRSSDQTEYPSISFESISQLVDLCQYLKSNITNGGAA